MATNLTQFNEELQRVQKRFHDEDIVKFVKAVAIEVFRRIVLRTPVDTGRARGNWQIEINSPAEGVIDKFAKTGAHTALINREVQKLQGVNPFSIVHITNNVEYVYYLEYDKRSGQHPEGMVEVTIVEMKDWVSKI